MTNLQLALTDVARGLELQFPYDISDDSIIIQLKNSTILVSISLHCFKSDNDNRFNNIRYDIVKVINDNDGDLINTGIFPLRKCLVDCNEGHWYRVESESDNNETRVTVIRSNLGETDIPLLHIKDELNCLLQCYAK